MLKKQLPHKLLQNFFSAFCLIHKSISIVVGKRHIQVSLMHKMKMKKKYTAILAERLENMVNKVNLFEFK